MNVFVCGVCIVLVDDDGVCVDMIVLWLVQMVWEVFVVDGVMVVDFMVSGDVLCELLVVVLWFEQCISVQQLQCWLQVDDGIVVLDVVLSVCYVVGYVLGVWFVLCLEMVVVVCCFFLVMCFVIMCGSVLLVQFVVLDLQVLVSQLVFLLEGGNVVWLQVGLLLEKGEIYLLLFCIDCYCCFYEGIDNVVSVMQVYFDWEFGLVE